MTKLKILALATLMTGVVVSFPVHAQEEDDIVGYRSGEKSRDKISGYVAGGVAVFPEYPGSEDYDVVPGVIAKVNYGEYYYAQFMGPELKVNVIRDKKFNFGPLIGYDGGRDDVENDRVDLLDEVDNGLELGAFASYAFNEVFHSRDEVEFELSAVQDVASGHEGFIADLDASYSLPVHFHGTWRLGFSLGASYVSDDYADSYYSISSAESVASTLPTFNAEGGLDTVDAMITANYLLSNQWGIFGFAGVEQLVGDGEDTPITDIEGDDTSFSGGLALSYRF